MTRYLTNRKTDERYPINGCIIDPNAPAPLSRGFKIGKPHRNLPATVSLMKYMTPIKDQGHTNSCVASAFSSAYEYLLKKEGVAKPYFSRLFIYYNSRVLYFGNSHIMDSGTTLNSALQAVKKFGTCKGDVWAFRSHRINQKPPEQAYQNGRKYVTIQGFQIDVDLNEMKSCLADGYPFIFALSTFQSFGLATQNQGRVPVPGREEVANFRRGCHAMLAVGYSDRDRVFVVKNSWGKQFGRDGYCYIPYDYLANKNYCWGAMVIKRIAKDESEKPNNDVAWFCDSCKKTEHVSSNSRYHCMECHNFDLCEKCYNAKVEPKTHRWSHKMRRTPAQRSLNITTIEVITTPGDPIHGIHATTMGSNSSVSQPAKHYPPNENPTNAIDQNLNTKYLNFGDNHSGLNTGFYVTPQKGKSMVTEIQFTTAKDFPERDPIAFVLEGSNASVTELDKGSSWVGICSGETGLNKDPGRLKHGPVHDISNSKFYTSYRILITRTRHQTVNCVQYSGCTLFGKIAVNSPTRGLSNTNDDDNDADDDEEEENERIGWNVDDDFQNISAMQGFDLNDVGDWCIETDD